MVFDVEITASVILLFVEIYCKDSIPVYFIAVLVNKLRIYRETLVLEENENNKKVFQSEANCPRTNTSGEESPIEQVCRSLGVRECPSANQV